jgi:hypothetical protein
MNWTDMPCNRGPASRELRTSTRARSESLATVKARAEALASIQLD